MLADVETKPSIWTTIKVSNKSTLKFIWSSIIIIRNTCEGKVVPRRQRNAQKLLMFVPSCCFSNLNLLLFAVLRLPSRRRCWSSLMLIPSKTAYKSSKELSPQANQYFNIIGFLEISRSFCGSVFLRLNVRFLEQFWGNYRKILGLFFGI